MRISAEKDLDIQFKRALESLKFSENLGIRTIRSSFRPALSGSQVVAPVARTYSMQVPYTSD